MAGPDDILLNIGIEGTEDATGKLKQLGEEGKSALQSLGSAFGPLGEAAAEFSAALIGIGTAIGGWAHQASEAITEMSHLAAQAGTTITQMSALEGTFASMGVNTDSLGVAFKRLAVQIESQWGQIQKSIRDSSSLAINDMLGMQSAALSVEKAQANLVTAQQKLRELTTGEKVDPAIAQMQAVKAAVLAVEEAELRVAEAAQKRADAVKKANDDQKNSMETVGQAVQSIASGQASFAEASKSANLELQNVIKGLILSTNAGQGAAEGLQGFTGSLGDVTSQAPKAKEVFYQLADFMKNSGDASINTAVAFRLFGRGVRADLIEALSEGSAAIKDHEKHLEELGLVYSKADEDIAKGLHKATAALEYDLKTTSNQIGNLFSPAWTEVANNFAKAIEGAHARIIEFAQAVANDVNPAISDFFKMITGDDNFTSRWGQIFGLIQDIGRYIGDVLGPVIKVLATGIGIVFDAFNKVAGVVRLMLVDIELFAKQVAAVGELLIKWDFDTFRKQMNAAFDEAAEKKRKILSNLAGEKPEEKEAEKKAAESAPAAGGKDLASSFEKVEVPDGNGGTTTMLVNKGSTSAVPKVSGTTSTQTGSADDYRKRSWSSVPAGKYEPPTEEGKEAFRKMLLEGAEKQPGAGEEPRSSVSHEDWYREVSGDISERQYNDRWPKRAPVSTEAAPQLTDTMNSFEKGMVAKLNSWLEALSPPPASKTATGAITGELEKRDQSPALLADQLGLGGVGEAIKASITNALNSAFGGGDDDTKKNLGELGTKAGEAGTYMDSLKSQLGGLSDAVGNAITAINSKASQVNVSADKDQEVGGYAEGGRVRAPGDGSRDTVLAGLANNEYVHSARATAHYGFKFMEDVNNLRIPKFNLGGLVTAISDNLSIVPSFAGGGPVVAAAGEQSNNVFAGHYTVDMRTDKGSVKMIAPPHAAEQLRNWSAEKRVARTGPMPSFME